MSIAQMVDIWCDHDVVECVCVRRTAINMRPLRGLWLAWFVMRSNK